MIVHSGWHWDQFLIGVAWIEDEDGWDIAIHLGPAVVNLQSETKTD